MQLSSAKKYLSIEYHCPLMAQAVRVANVDVFSSSQGGCSGSGIRHRRWWSVRIDSFNHGVDVPAVARSLRDGSGRAGVPLARNGQQTYGHTGVGDAGVRCADCRRSAALRSGRSHSDDVDWNANGLHLGGDQCAGAALSARTGARHTLTIVSSWVSEYLF